MVPAGAGIECRRAAGHRAFEMGEVGHGGLFGIVFVFAFVFVRVSAAGERGPRVEYEYEYEYDEFTSM